ncbi:inner centromere protein A isoform X2 [Oncorhynchus tshawytscha]|uniref:inner centromere protein A isoform X2 n=1 Tax=Oncorhynchus tshawytscha TaxID=74940 RepID=UPI001C3E3961|nr:inner centromere protein A isoform X2 [Oncorhynchus tshawytscha]
MVATMTSVLSSTHTLMQMFNGKIQEFANEIENVHMVWLEEIQQEANRMFSSDFSAEPELMPKTPSQKKSNRRKRLSVGQNENRTKRRFSKGKRSNLRRSSVSTSLNLIAEDDGGSPVTLEDIVKPPRSRRAKQTTQPEAAPPVCSTRKGAAPTTNSQPEEMEYEAPSKHIQEERMQPEEAESKRESFSSVASQPHCLTPPQTQSHIAEAIVKISASERRSADLQMNPNPERSPSRTATKIAIAAGTTPPGPRRSSVRHSLTVRRSLAGLRHSMTQESVRRASRRSFLKKKARMGSSTCSSNVSGHDVWMETDGHEVQVQTDGVLSEEPAKTKTDSPSPETSPEDNTVQNHPGVLSVTEVRRFTRSMAQTTPTVPPPASIISKAKTATPDSGSDGSGKKPSLGPRLSAKRRAAADEFQSPRKKPSPPVKSQSVRPNMRSFLHTVQKNQMLMMTPSSLGRNTVMKSFIKHTTPGRADLKSGCGVVERERLKLEALKKKQEQEDERKKKMEEEKRRKQEEMKKKRDERLRRVVEARVKEEQKEEEKKKKIEQKMLQIDEKHDKLRVERMAEEKAKKKVATKRQEELELRRKMEEDVRRKKIQQSEEEEKRQQELQAKRRAEEEQERARKMTEARRALELKKELERELERERQASAERERVEREKAIALQRDVEKAAREKERRELEKRKREEQQRQAEEERQREAERLAERQREAERLAERQREAERLAERQREAERLAERQREAAERHLTAEVQVLKTPVGKGGVLNVTVDIEQSPQSYEITPKGGNKPVVLNTNPEDYGMDQNSDDSTDDESAPRKPIPTWAEGNQLKQSMMKQYFHPADVDSHYGAIEPPKLDRIFCKSKPRYFKRTSSAVWHSPPRMGALPL